MQFYIGCMSISTITRSIKVLSEVSHDNIILGRNRAEIRLWNVSQEKKRKEKQEKNLKYIAYSNLVDFLSRRYVVMRLCDQLISLATTLTFLTNAKHLFFFLFEMTVGRSRCSDSSRYDPLGTMPCLGLHETIGYV